MTLQQTHPLNPAAAVGPSRCVLHVGCGGADPAKLPEAFFPAVAWREIRLDIDPGVAPDIIASITACLWSPPLRSMPSGRPTIWNTSRHMRCRWHWPNFTASLPPAALPW